MPKTVSQNMPISTLPCDCIDCLCSPCADPRKRRGQTAPLSAKTSCIDRPQHPEGCVCDACLCGDEDEIADEGTPGIGPQVDQKILQVASGVGAQVGQKMSKVASGR